MRALMSVLVNQLPNEHSRCILHARVKVCNLKIIPTDIVPRARGSLPEFLVPQIICRVFADRLDPILERSSKSVCGEPVKNLPGSFPNHVAYERVHIDVSGTNALGVDNSCRDLLNLWEISLHQSFGGF